MSVHVQRRRGESFEAMFRRFTRRVSASGTILQKRKIRYVTDEPNRSAKKSSALRRLEIAKKRDYLMKVGRLVETKKRGRS